MSGKPAPVEESAGSESGRSQKDKRQSARLTGQPAPQPQVPATEGSSSTPQAAKAASKKGKKAKETQPEPEQEVQPEQPEQQQLPRDDSTPRQFFRAFGFSEAQPGPQSSGFGVRSPPPSYAQGPEQQMEPWHPSERADQQPERVSWLDAAPPIEPQPAAKQGAGDKDADGKGDEADEDEQEERMKVPSGKQTKTHQGQNKSQKEIAEQQHKQSNSKKAETWAEIMSNSGSRQDRKRHV